MKLQRVTVLALADVPLSFPRLNVAHEPDIGPDTAGPQIQLAESGRRVLQQLLRDLEGLLARSVFRTEHMLMADALTFALRVVEVCAAQPMPHPFAQDAAPNLPHLLR